MAKAKKILWQGKKVTIEELNAGELMGAYDAYRDLACNDSSGSIYIILDMLYTEIIRRMEK